jgi:UDP-GlcNAc:undecaprenyl-phosphate/decaprenyl-phosphate GlcNAc-1-phosphate transferase
VAAYVAIFLVTAGAAAVATPVVRLLAVKFGAIDRPSDRKVHPKPTPTIGGAAIWVAMLAGLGTAYLMPAFRNIFSVSSEPLGVAMAGTVIVLVGAFDDIWDLPVPAKVAGQVLAAGLLLLNGVQLVYFWFPGLGVVSLGPDLAVPLTLVWVLAVVNAVNLIDGLDGLAAGIVAIAAAAFFVWVYVEPSSFPESTHTAALLCAVVAGAALGFLPYNFYPARIFMGDSGSMLLGLLLASATIAGVGRTLQPHGGDVAAFAIPVLIPVFVLAVPLIDVAMAVIRRVRRGRPVFAPDKEHIHHQLRQIGHTHSRAVLIMYYWAILLAGSGLAVSFLNGRVIVGSILVAALALIAATLVPRRLRERRRARRVAKAAKTLTEAEVGSKPA